MEHLGTIKMYSVDDVCKILGIGGKKCLDLFHSGDFPSLQIGKTLLIKESAFDSYLDSKRRIRR